MFRMLLFWAMLLIAAAPQGLWAQSAEVKPTQILPERDNLPLPSTDERRKTGPQIQADLPLYEDVDVEGRREFVISAVQIDDGGLLTQASYAEIIENFVGRKASDEELQALTKAVANEARAAGYIFATAMIPAQSVKMGILRVTVDPGTIDRVSVKGPENKFVKRLFNRLQGRPGRQAEIEQAIIVASDYPGISIDKTRFRRKNGKGILTVSFSKISDQVYAAFDNYGTRNAGPVRARMTIDKHGVLSDRDWLGAQVLITPVDPEQLTFVSARYSNIFTDDGKSFVLTGAAGRTWHPLDGGTVMSNSRSRYVAAKVSAPLVQAGHAHIAFNLEGAFLSVDRVFSDGRFRDDDIATINMSVSGNANFAGGRLAAGVEATQGLDIFGATGANDPNSSRRDGSGRFTKGEFWLNWTRKLGKNYSVRTTAKGQLASRPLLSSQEIDLGGPRFGRGFDFSERSGDQGLLASFELRKFISKPAKHVSSAQFYAFGDGGYIDNLRSGRGGATLISAGGGVRASFGRIELGLEIAVPVKGQREYGGKSPKLNAAIGFSF